jgi:Fe2+ or Zn2+ uptake regulation protein
MNQTYYNTNRLTGAELKKAVADAARQERSILLIFENTGAAFSPSTIHLLMQRAGKKYPLTSIRRAITNLQKAGHLMKLDNLVPGAYGKPEHQWKIAGQS